MQRMPNTTRLIVLAVTVACLLTALAFSLSRWFGLTCVLSLGLLAVLMANIRGWRERLPGFPAPVWWQRCLLYAGYVSVAALMLWLGSLTIPTAQQAPQDEGARRSPIAQTHPLQSAQPVSNPQDTAPQALPLPPGNYTPVSPLALLPRQPTYGRVLTPEYHHVEYDGSFALAYTDLAIPTLGSFDLSFARYYNSNLKGSTGLGHGWRVTRYQIIPSQAQQPDEITVLDHLTGQRARFPKQGQSGEGLVYRSTLPAFRALLVGTGEEPYTLLARDHTSLHFDRDGQLSALLDPNGNAILYHYEAGRLSRIADATGRTITLRYNAAGQVVELQDPAARKLVYRYNRAGDLVGVQDPLGHRLAYHYDGSHRLTQVIDRQGHPALQNAYNPAGQVVQHRGSHGEPYRLAYGPEPGKMTLTDSRGAEVVRQYDAWGRLTQERDSAGATLAFAYNRDGHPVQITDQMQRTTLLQYDAGGNLLQITDPAPVQTTMTFAYNDRHDVVRLTDRRGMHTTFEYDERHNLRRLTDAAGHVTHLEYDSRGLLVQRTDANGEHTTFHYDLYGNLVAMRDPPGHEHQVVYDALSRPVKRVDPLGRTWTYQYDASNHLTSLTTPAGARTRYDYDPHGQVTSITDPLGQITALKYDQAYQLVEVREAGGARMRFSYDAQGNLTGVLDARNQQTRYAYDPLKRLVQTINAAGETTHYAWNPDHTLKSQTDPWGRTTQYSYNSLGRLATLTFPDNTRLAWTYDANGNVVERHDALGVTRYTYDPLNRFITEALPSSQSFAYGYDRVGRMTSLQRPDQELMRFTYDANARLTSITRGSSAAATLLHYSAAGDLLEQTSPDGIKMTSQYDPAGRLLGKTITSPTGMVQRWQQHLDPMGRPVQIREHQTWGKHAEERTVSITYDSMSRPTALKASDKTWMRMDYDAMGHLVRLKTPTDTVMYTYDALNRPAVAGDRRYHYDGRNSQVSVKTGTGELRYGYDPLGRLATFSTGGEPTRFTYRADGLPGKVEAPGVRADYLWPRAPVPQRMTELTSFKTPGQGKEPCHTALIGMPDRALGLPAASLTPDIVWPHGNPLLKPMGDKFATGLQEGAIKEFGKAAIKAIPGTAIEMFPTVFDPTFRAGSLTSLRVGMGWQADDLVADVHLSRIAWATRDPAWRIGVTERWGQVVNNMAPLVSTAWTFRGELRDTLSGTAPWPPRRRYRPSVSKALASLAGR